MSNEIIIKKVKKGGHDGHHGGAWKVAYADFVTAMMAFFLLMWLLNATSEEQKRGIADYFSPVAGALKSPSGGIGFLGGQSAASKGSLNSATAPPSVSVSLQPPSAKEEGEETGGVASKEEGGAKDVSREELERLLAEREAQRFAEAEQRLRQAIQEIPELKALAENLIIDQTPEGLRIQVVDQSKQSMFPAGSAEMYPHTRRLLAVVAEIVFRMPNDIAISGHTDSMPFTDRNGFGNWELSSARANASRRAMIEAGLPPKKIVSVVGKADQDLLLPNDPTSPRNRRISMVLLRETPVERR